MRLGPFFIITLARLTVAIVALVCRTGGGGRLRTARGMLDEGYSRGERRRDAIAGRACASAQRDR